MLATCNKKHTSLTMHFTINLAFTNYLDLMPNLTEHLTLNRDATSFEQPLPVYLNISCFDNSLSTRPGKLKDFMYKYIQSTSDKEFFELQKGHATHTLSPYKKFLFQQNCEYFYIYFFHNFNGHNNTCYLLVL